MAKAKALGLVPGEEDGTLVEATGSGCGWCFPPPAPLSVPRHRNKHEEYEMADVGVVEKQPERPEDCIPGASRSPPPAASPACR